MRIVPISKFNNIKKIIKNIFLLLRLKLKIIKIRKSDIRFCLYFDPDPISNFKTGYPIQIILSLPDIRYFESDKLGRIFLNIPDHCHHLKIHNLILYSLSSVLCPLSSLLFVLPFPNSLISIFNPLLFQMSMTT